MQRSEQTGPQRGALHTLMDRGASSAFREGLGRKLSGAMPIHAENGEGVCCLCIHLPRPRLWRVLFLLSAEEGAVNMENHRTNAEPAGEIGWACHPPIIISCHPPAASPPWLFHLPPLPYPPAHVVVVGGPGHALEKKKEASVLVCLFSAVQQTLLEK